ncbi:DUF1036 domain-containing protein [Paracoccus sp. Ld10]|uniref:DUF1036 domain-containing protein n=1 Tax=Paracoccus sp. Ld10 TaxID=649158 RepID=UPI003862D9EE
MRAIPLIVATAWIAACPAVGHAAGLRLCNQSFDVLNVAIGTPQGAGQVQTRGWWRVAPNQCATLLRQTLHERRYHVFAADVFGNEVLTGSIPMCVAPRRFDISGQQDCLLRGFLDARFIEIDTMGQKNWTVFVTPRPD